MGNRDGEAPVRLSNVRVVDVLADDLSVGDPADILVAGGEIQSIEPAGGTGVSREPDGGGRFALPGLVNAHDHLYSKELRNTLPGMDLAAMRAVIDARDEMETIAVMLKNAWRSMAEGVLVVRDLGARHGLNTRLAEMISTGLAPGPMIVPSARPVVMTGGHVWTFGREADGPDECRRAVREQRKAGARVIKVMASGGLSHFPHEDYTVSEFTDEELAAITSEAQKLGIPTCAHAFGTEAVEAALRAGIDCIEHGVHLDEATVATMADHRVGYVPTMANMARIASPEFNASAGVPDRAVRFRAEVVDPQRASVARAARAGVRIGVGTDSTGTYAEELGALAAAGLDHAAILRAATVDGADICGVRAGVLAPGRAALIALYDTDPREDVSRLTEPSAVFVRDRLIETLELRRVLGL